MTKRFVEENGITVERLKRLALGETIPRIRVASMVNPDVVRGGPNSGYPDAEVSIQRGPAGFVFGDSLREIPENRYGVRVYFGQGSSQGPVCGGQTAEQVVEKLEGKDYAQPGEIKNKGE